MKTLEQVVQEDKELYEETSYTAPESEMPSMSRDGTQLHLGASSEVSVEVPLNAGREEEEKISTQKEEEEKVPEIKPEVTLASEQVKEMVRREVVKNAAILEGSYEEIKERIETIGPVNLDSKEISKRAVIKIHKQATEFTTKKSNEMRAANREARKTLFEKKDNVAYI